MEPLSVFFILIPIGLAVGIFAAITGLGGGVLMVPILLHGIFAFSDPVLDTIKYATTISSTVIIFTAASGAIAFSIQKRIDYIVGLLCVPFTIGGATLGKYAQSELAEDIILVFFAILLILTAIRMFYKIIISRRKALKVNNNNSTENEKEIENDKTKEEIDEPSRFKLFLNKLTRETITVDNTGKLWSYKARLFLTPIAFIGGFVASMAGVGGGIVMVPVLHILIGLPIHFSTATSVFIMIFTKSTTLITSYVSAYTGGTVVVEGIWWPYVAGLAIGIVGGAQIGAILAKRIKADPLKIVFASVLVLVSIWTIISWQLPPTS
ncbi:MAG: sulfite exporter TauE/SafE family protein [Asgard group archaeon]|nr:sulfite exporter TauE/SafE family protein [Asgard group archaeon]